MVTDSPFLPEHFERVDEAADSEFYSQPRFVVHIDDQAIEAAGRVYASLLPRDGEILDLMSSWRSHIPAGFPVSRLVGLGMNAEEMAGNPQLDAYVVHDLNLDPTLSFETDQFDGVIDTVSIQYLTRPVEVFAEVYRVLRPAGRFVVTFSNRCFPTKAVRVWTALGDKGHAQLIASYFLSSARWSDLQAVECNPARGAGDPLFAVHASKPPAGSPRPAGRVG
ncbi:MAG TPA: methyltransferase domain-containing protein [Dehalococcoidia bacterium]|nr:methyltransferase domain-containing protein [Dehalococcoidia bacterium]